MTGKSVDYSLTKLRTHKKKFINIKGSRFEVTPDGLLYCPGGACAKKKHNCSDCYFCQWCSDSRCSLCRSLGKPPRRDPGHS